MIWLGLRPEQKEGVIQAYLAAHGLRRVVILTPPEFAFPHTLARSETVPYAQIIEYATFYRLMQEIDSGTLLVINECQRTQNRHDLTYNCIRNYLTQTPHQIVFQRLPIIASREDFMILVDWDTRSRWKRERFSPALLGEATIQARPVDIQFHVREAQADDRLRDRYARRKAALVAGLGAGDPDILPRKLYQVAQKERLGLLRPDLTYLSTRTLPPRVLPYAQAPATECGIFEFPFRFSDLRDHLTRHPQTAFDVVATDLPADRWFVNRYRQWSQEVRDVLALVS